MPAQWMRARPSRQPRPEVCLTARPRRPFPAQTDEAFAAAPTAARLCQVFARHTLPPPPYSSPHIQFRSPARRLDPDGTRALPAAQQHAPRAPATCKLCHIGSSRRGPSETPGVRAARPYAPSPSPAKAELSPYACERTPSHHWRTLGPPLRQAAALKAAHMSCLLLRCYFGAQRASAGGAVGRGWPARSFALAPALSAL